MCRGNGLRGGGVRCVRAIEINTRRQAEMCVEREIKRQGEEREREREGTAKTSLKNAKLADRRRVSQLKSSKKGAGGRHI